MKCPHCNTDLVKAKRDGLDVDLCPSCQGMWLSRQELEQLEDEAFDFGDNVKGSLMLGSDATTFPCPQCAKPMREFGYRLFDLALDYCPDGHGYWLDADEDKRVLALMAKEEEDLERKTLAEERWGVYKNYLRSGSFIDKLHDLAQQVIDIPYDLKDRR